MTDPEFERVGLIQPDGGIIDAEFKLWEEDPSDRAKVRLSLLISAREITRSDNDFFSAMCSIRRELEKDRLLLNCYGASRDVYPSPLSQDMGSGWKAHKLQIGRPAREEDAVSIFDVGPDVIPALVDEQEEFYREWLNSLEYR
jgi:hypothetical protein